MTKLIVKMLMLGTVLYSSTGFAQQPQSPPPTTQSTSMQRIIKEYYLAYEKKDWTMMEPILAVGFTFTSPLDDHIDVNAYKERCWPNAIHTKKFDLERIIIEGDDAYVTYNGWTTGGKLFRNTERFKFKDGKIKENECFFGTGVSFPNSTQK